MLMLGGSRGTSIYVNIDLPSHIFSRVDRTLVGGWYLFVLLFTAVHSHKEQMLVVDLVLG